MAGKDTFDNRNDIGQPIDAFFDLLAELLFEEWKNEVLAGNDDEEPVDEGGT